MPSFSLDTGLGDSLYGGGTPSDFAAGLPGAAGRGFTTGYSSGLAGGSALGGGLGAIANAFVPSPQMAVALGQGRYYSAEAARAAAATAQLQQATEARAGMGTVLDAYNTNPSSANQDALWAQVLKGNLDPTTASNVM